jgi:hypothetical protein
VAALVAACGYPSQVAPFCEEAVPIIDGRTPYPPEVDMLKALAIQVLPAETAEGMVVELDLLQFELQGDSPPGYSTGAVAQLVTDVCNVEVRAITSNPPLVGSDDPLQPSR